MEIANFSIANPEILRLEFSLNQDYVLEEDSISVSMQMNIGINKGRDCGQSTLELTIGDNNKGPFLVHAKMRASALFNDEMATEEKEKILQKDVAEYLYAYLRPIVSNITTLSKYPTYVLPCLNFT